MRIDARKTVHIGFPKTATTFLQWNVFPYLKGVKYVSYNECRNLFQRLVYADPLDYPLDELTSEIQSEKNTLYSFESLAGSPFYYKGIGRSSIPSALKTIGFNKIIITIRSQEKAIDSFYRQYVVQGGTLSFQNWLDIDNKRPIPQKYFQLGYLKYDGLISRYVEVFGRENVLLLNQQDLKQDESAFIGKIEDFTNSTYEHPDSIKKANESLTNLSILLLRFSNHFTFSSVRPFHFFWNRISNRFVWKIFAVILDPYFLRFLSRKKSYVDKYKLGERIRDFYTESNDQLKRKWEIDL